MKLPNKLNNETEDKKATQQLLQNKFEKRDNGVKRQNFFY